MGGIIAILLVFTIFITAINSIEMRDDIKDLKKELANIKEKTFNDSRSDSTEMKALLEA
jgi:predicted Holliday junction resolvase-like endonuclease